MNEMIPTEYKDQLPKDLSWPINAKLLSEGLKGVVQFEKLTLSFYGCSTFRKSEFQTRIKNKVTILVISAEYANIKPLSRYAIEKGWGEERWEMSVYGVPREAKRIVREAILSSGVSAIRAWLTKQRPPSWYEGRKSISLGFDLDREVLVKEISED